VDALSVLFPGCVEDLLDSVQVGLESLADADFSRCFKEFPVGPAAARSELFLDYRVFEGIAVDG
jgi:hypothetical protein